MAELPLYKDASVEITHNGVLVWMPRYAKLYGPFKTTRSFVNFLNKQANAQESKR